MIVMVGCSSKLKTAGFDAAPQAVRCSAKRCQVQKGSRFTGRLQPFKLWGGAAAANFSDRLQQLLFVAATLFLRRVKVNAEINSENEVKRLAPWRRQQQTPQQPSWPTPAGGKG